MPVLEYAGLKIKGKPDAGRGVAQVHCFIKKMFDKDKILTKKR